MNLSARAIADKLGISHTAVNKAAKRGRITKERDGGFNLAKVRRELETNTDLAQQKRGKSGKRKPAEPQAPRGKTTDQNVSLYELQRREALARTKEREIKVQRLEGKLVDAAEVARHVQARADAEKQATLNLPARISPEGASELHVDEKLLRAWLERAVRRHLSERSGRAGAADA